MVNGLFMKGASFFYRLMAIILPYWKSEEKGRAWLLLLSVVTLSLGIVYINVLINDWNNDFYNSLQKLDMDAFFRALLKFSYLAGIYIIIAVYLVYLNQMLQIRWRTWLTKRFLRTWLDNGKYYYLQLEQNPDSGAQGVTTDNPDQRISEDLSEITALTLELGLGLLRSVVSLASFSLILWSLSGALEFAMGTVNIVIPGYMFWLALSFATFGTWLAIKIGGPLAKLNFMQQKREADFRFSMVRLRENAANIAVYRGENYEEGVMQGRFSLLVENFWQIMRRQKKLTWASSGYNQAAVIFPFLVAAPRFFSGGIQLGGLMQTASAFSHVHDSLSFIVNSFTTFARWKAVAERLTGFVERMREIDASIQAGKLTLAVNDNSRVRLKGVSVKLPQGRVLVENLEFELQPGRSLLITGASGCGKSTLLRTVAGIWPWCEGNMELPPRDRIMFLSQTPYLPLGTLKECLCFPFVRMDADETEIAEILTDCKLEHLAPRLNYADDYSAMLSPGEKQRLAICRIVLGKPACVFLDEAFSSLDADTETSLKNVLLRRLPYMTKLEISHKSAGKHDYHLHLRILGNGGWRIEDSGLGI